MARGMAINFWRDSLVMAGNVFHRADEFLPLFLHQFVGENGVGNLHDVARRENILRHLVGQREDFQNHQRGARQRFENGALAAFDAASDFHFAFAREQRHRAHFAQIHANRVVDLFSADASGQLQVEEFVAFFELFLEILGFFEDFNTGDVQTGEDVVEFGAAIDIAGQNFTYFVVQDVPLFLTHLYEPFEPVEFVIKRH